MMTEKLIADLRKKNDQLRTVAEERKEEVEALTDQVRRKGRVLDERKRDIKNLVEQLQETRDELEAALSTNDKKEIFELKKTLKEYKGRLSGVKAHISDLHAKLNKVREARDVVVATEASVRRVLDRTEQEVRSLKHQVNAKTDLNRKAQSRTEEMREALYDKSNELAYTRVALGVVVAAAVLICWLLV